MVGAYHGIARVKQGLDDGAEVGGTLTVVAEPGTTVDVDDNGIAGLFLLGQVDVTCVESLVVTGIVYILSLLRSLKLRLLLETTKASETALRLSCCTEGTASSKH